MDKQKKQILLLVLVVAVGGAALLFLYKDKIFSKPPEQGPVAAAPDPAAGTPPPAGTTPPGQPGQPPAAGQPAAPVDLPKPELKVPLLPGFSVDLKTLRDPLLVLDPDAAYPGSQEEIERIKREWDLRGIAIVGKEQVKTFKKRPDGSEDPNPEIVERDIWACFFHHTPRYYREGDRLDGTHFVVETIHFTAEGAFVEVVGDQGIRIKLQMITNDRYGNR